MTVAAALLAVVGTTLYTVSALVVEAYQTSVALSSFSGILLGLAVLAATIHRERRNRS